MSVLLKHHPLGGHTAAMSLWLLASAVASLSLVPQSLELFSKSPFHHLL